MEALVVTALAGLFSLAAAGVSGYAAVKARQAEVHTRPNGSGDRIPEMVEQIRDNVSYMRGRLDTHIKDERAHLVRHVRHVNDQQAHGGGA